MMERSEIGISVRLVVGMVRVLKLIDSQAAGRQTVKENSFAFGCPSSDNTCNTVPSMTHLFLKCAKTCVGFVSNSVGR
jgi:hypothetical protein